MKKNVCILYGGRSQEHEVSLQSAASVYNFINKDIFSTLAIGIERDGTWHYQNEIKITRDPARGNMLVLSRQKEPVSVVPGRGFFHNGKKLPVDIVFPVLHGSFGEDGTLQGFLEMLDLPYVGAGVLGSALAIDKEKVKRVWKEAGLPVVEFELIRKEEYFSSRENRDRIVESIEDRFTYPVFVKPSCTGSSVGVHKVSAHGDLKKAVEQAFQFDTKVLVERAIDAREIECSVIGNKTPRAFAPGEVIPTHSFYSYDAKYLDPNGAELVVPAAVKQELAEQVMDLAVRAYHSAEVEGLSRVDLFLDRKTGELWLNEINTLPGFTHISMFPRMCEAGGLPYPELLEALIQFGFERFQERANLRYNF